MFTVAAFAAVAILSWVAKRANEKDHKFYDDEIVEGKVTAVDLHARQDLQLIAFLLMGIIVLLGIIADRI